MTTDSAQGIQGLHAAFWKAKAETSTPQPVARKEDLKSRAFVRMLKARLLHIVAVCIAAASPDLSATYAQVADINIRHWLVIIIFGRLMVVSGAVLAITAAQAWISRRQARLLVMTLAVLVFSAATAVLNASDWYIGLQNIDPLAWTSSGLGLFLHLFWLNTVTTSLLAIVYERQMQADRMMMAVSSTRLADGEVERQTLESRLNSVKARVDPEFLFAVIERSEILYRNDIDAAEVLLDQLIDFLRTSVPQANGAHSTLEKEWALCVGYLEIEAQLRPDALHLQTSNIAVVASHRFPTSILLQLVQSLLLQLLLFLFLPLVFL